MNKVDKWKINYRGFDSRCPEVDDSKYLLENNEIMINFLQAAGLDFSDGNYFHDKTVPNSGIRNRPDHRFEKEKIIVEFDGIQHYQQVGVIKRDRKKDNIYREMGYAIIRIPYFIQPSTETLRYYFNVEGETPLQYPHGFIIYDSMPPTNFCSLGLDRFIDEFNSFPEVIKKDVVKSLDKLITLGEDYEYVIPKQCEELFREYR